ncbi:MAG TPA: AI-2E family transporter [Anaerolineae bacterium]|nr:AI-2E family transporter [Anaerolineae bacterium]
MEQPDHFQSSPQWSPTVKLVVSIIGLLFITILAYRFQEILAWIIIAAILAYIVNPICTLIADRSPLERNQAILVTYMVIAIVAIAIFVALGVAAYSQTLNFVQEAPALIDQALQYLQNLIERPEPIFSFGPIELTLSTLDWEAIRTQVITYAESVFSRGGQALAQLASATLRIAGNTLVIFIISIYVAIEIPLLGDYVARLAHTPGYQADAERLFDEFMHIWSAYLRGQVILGLVIGFIVWLTLALLGVSNAIALGILSGLLEFIPVIGPFVGTVAAVTVAFFQPASYIGLEGFQLAGVVLIAMLIIQQLENSVLVPRIVGDALGLHPLLVMVCVFMGSSLAGLLGAILAAPVTATIKLLSIYAWRKLFDLPPFPDKDPLVLEEGESNGSTKLLTTITDRINQLRGK